MNEILLVNPRRRRKKTAKRKTSVRRRRRNPSPPGSAGKAVRRNPARRRRRAKSRVSRRRRRNPIAGMNKRNLMGFASAAASGAAGAIALDVALSYIPLPAMLKTGVVGKITKGFAAVALGLVAKKTGVVKDSTARDMTVGALTVQFTGIGRDLLAQFAPGVALSAYYNEDYAASLGYAGSGWNPANPLAWGGLNAYNVGNGFPIAAPGDGQPGLSAYESDSAFGW